MQAPVKNNYTPTKRFQHSAVFHDGLMLILGGRNENDSFNSMPIESYDSENMEWTSHFTFDKFRHSSFTLDRFVFSQGGFDYSNPIEPTDKIVMFDVEELCSNYLYKKYE